MTPPPARWLVLVGAATCAFGVAALVLRVMAYLDNPRAISSTAGLLVFRSPGGYVSYAPFETTIEPAVIGIGVALLLAGILVAAAVWRPRA